MDQNSLNAMIVSHKKGLAKLEREFRATGGEDDDLAVRIRNKAQFIDRLEDRLVDVQGAEEGCTSCVL